MVSSIWHGPCSTCFIRRIASQAATGNFRNDRRPHLRQPDHRRIDRACAVAGADQRHCFDPRRHLFGDPGPRDNGVNELPFEDTAMRDVALARRGFRLGKANAKMMGVSCCRFHGHQVKVFLELEDEDGTTQVQPRVQARGGEAGSGAWGKSGAGISSAGGETPR